MVRGDACAVHAGQNFHGASAAIAMTITKQLPGGFFTVQAMKGQGETMGKNWLDVALAGGGFVALLKFIQWCLEKALSRKKKTTVLEGINSLYRVYAAMEKSLGGPAGGAECGRVLLLSAHNSGGIPSPAVPFYTSAIHWAISAVKHRQAISGYSNIKVDGAYIKMLLEMQRDGMFHFDMAKNEGSMLHDFYSAEGVKDSYLFFVGVVGGQFVYLSFASFDGILTRDQVTGFSITANEVQNLIGDK